jgi:hypothetical protein
MGLLQLTQKRSDGIDLIDTRASLYYNKYRYRARFYCTGITICWFCKNDKDVDERAKKHKSRWAQADLASVKQFLAWKNNNITTGKSKTATVRIEGNIASVFSNDLDLLKTLEGLGSNVDYTEVDSSIPEGVKYFTRDPDYKYRIYLKSKRVKGDFHEKLKNFVDRYKDTDNKMIPSPSLKMWLNIRKDPNGTRWTSNNWRLEFCSSHFFLDYNEESSLTLFMIMFQDSVSRKFKLEKRPD